MSVLFENVTLGPLIDQASDFVKQKFLEDEKKSEEDFLKAWDTYLSIPPFRINDNIFDIYSPESKNDITDDVLTVVRYMTQYMLILAFDAMKIDLQDPNVVMEPEVGNIGTPGRIAKMWTGKTLNDATELMCGRWNKAPRLARFPNTHSRKIPITKRVDLNAVCSHHAAIFSSMYSEDSYALISYIPDKFELGISKLQRYTDYVARRGWLQEDLAKALYDGISKIAETDSVYIRLYRIVHSCEKNRGAQSHEGSFTTEYYGGAFEDPALRNEVKNC